MKVKFVSLLSGIFKSFCYLFVWNRINEMVIFYKVKNKVLDLKIIIVICLLVIFCIIKNNENLLGKLIIE